MVGIVIGALAGLIVWIFAAMEFQRIAALKGYDEMKYFWWTFLLGPVGMMMVIALPQRISVPAPPAPAPQTPPAKAPESDELPDI